VSDPKLRDILHLDFEELNVGLAASAPDILENRVIRAFI